MMHENVYANDFKDLKDLNSFIQKGTNINCINKFRLITNMPFGLTMEEINK